MNLGNRTEELPKCSIERSRKEKRGRKMDMEDSSKCLTGVPEARIRKAIFERTMSENFLELK